ncbi:putative vacuolar membrane protein [Diplonema papillatum]|nr:putative vacuolar membrane protein [Diplonema papillatum]
MATLPSLAVEKDYAVGLALLVLVALIWVAASHLIQAVFESSFQKPFFLTYFNTVGFSFWLLGAACKKEWRAVTPWADAAPHAPLPDEPTDGSEQAAPLTWRSYVRIALSFSPLWVAANYTFNLSLSKASVASVTILSNTSSLWTMLLSAIFLAQPLAVTSVASVFMTLAGTVLVAHNDPLLVSTAQTSGRSQPLFLEVDRFRTNDSWHRDLETTPLPSVLSGAAWHDTLGTFLQDSPDAAAGGNSRHHHRWAIATKDKFGADAGSNATSDGEEERFQGSLLALLSACCYAVYTVHIRRAVPEEVIIPMLFGYVGLIVLVGGLPVLAALHAFGWETFEVPPGRVLLLLAINSAIGTNLSDVLWAKAVVLTSPLVATLALSLTIPFGLISDVIMSDVSYNLPYTCGALMILSGFVLVNTCTGRSVAQGEVPAAFPDADDGEDWQPSDSGSDVEPV